jgi:O-antigen biosynthesis protein
MKIFYIQGDYNFCYYYRGYLPGVYSNQSVVPEFIRGDIEASGVDYLSKAMDADIICFQRPSGKEAYKLAKLLKEKGKYIIFDNDDSYSGVPLERLDNEKQVKIAQELNENLNNFVKLAHGVTVSTKILADEYSKINPNVVVLKNCIDPLDEYKPKENTTGKFRIGFIGSVTSNDDYHHIKEDIRLLDARNDITIVILGIKFPNGKIMPSMQEDYNFWSSLKNIEWHSVVPVTSYYSTLADLALDLAIIPRKEHYFNQCKSNLKFLDMSLLKIPVLAQGFKDGTSPYQGVDEKYMTLIVENDIDKLQWYNKIIEIKNDYQRFSNLACKAHDYVLTEYNINIYANEWQKQIENLCKFPKSI